MAFWLVKKMNGMSASPGSALTRLQKAKPSMTGILVSEMISSGGAILAFSRASSPLTAVVTEKPALRRLTSITRSDLVSPSTSSRLLRGTALASQSRVSARFFPLFV